MLEVIGTFRKDAVEAWNYTHPPLDRQLDEDGLRQFELDVYADPKGGLFAHPLGPKLALLSASKAPPFDPAGELKKPGFKILHVPDLDCWSNHPTLASALAAFRTWSDADPRHLPVMILIECKDEDHPPLPTRPLPFTRERLLELEAAILALLPREKLVIPDDIRAGSPTLREAVTRHGWPALDDCRGKFLFTLDNGGAIRDSYLEGNPSLEGRLFFVSAPNEAHPAAAWFKRNDPIRSFDEIRRLVQSGFLVRTRADGGRPDPLMRERAFESGAQWISTDHFSAGLPAESRAVFPDGATVRANPATGATHQPLPP